MNNKPIGIIDSGVGGLSIWTEIVSQLPLESTIYLADSKNLPYGSKKPDEVYVLAKGLVDFLVKKGVKLIVVACNTITVSCLSKLREDFPQVPIVGIVPVVKTAVEKTKNKKIGILSTESTAKSKYQKNLIETFANGCEVFNLGTNRLAPLVEQGKIEGEEISKVLNEELAKFKKEGVDTIAIGCSHFPFLRKTMQKIMGDKVIILDSAEAIARQTKRVLENENTLAQNQNPTHLFYTTGNAENFSSVARKLLGVTNIQAVGINIADKFKGKKIAIVGLGIEGFSTAKFLLKKGATVTILDRKEKEDLDKEIIAEIKNLQVKLVLGKDCLRNLNDFEIVVRSPGVKRDLEEFAQFEKNGGIITSQIKIFFDLCVGNIIGVTGTKGKGTTATLTYEMLKAENLDAYLGGNIGNAPLDFLDKLDSKSWVVLELSSFQLIDLTKSPHIAVMLMTTSEHLDYHKDVHEYIDAKRNILRFQKKEDFAIVNRDYPASSESDIYTDGKVFKISRESEVEGVFVKDDILWLKKDGETLKIIDSSEILLPGKHNLENVGAAIVASITAGVSLKNIIKVLKEFKGLEHRLQLVGEVRGVKYYDDSFSTTPETAIAAIESFTAPKILILGGSSKGSDFTELGNVIRENKNIKVIIGVGKEWEAMKKEFRLENVGLMAIEGAKNMKQIVLAASKIAEPGDVVLLSPACASFEMFKNYKDRGDQFKEEVNAL